MDKKQIAIIGSGPAGLAAAESLAQYGAEVVIYDAMPAPARKFLLAGKSGLNLTHAEDFAVFLTRFGAARPNLEAALLAFDAKAIQDWATGLGVETFVGSSGRIFPKAMKASPLLRAWLRRLDAAGVVLKTRHKWLGFDGDCLAFETPEGRKTLKPDAVILALGGASWPRLGSTAEWVKWLEDKHIPIAPFRPANCGFDVPWSAVFSERFAGQPVKSIIASSNMGALPGEFVIARKGIEGSLVYAHSAALRDALERTGAANLTLDLAPGRTLERLAHDLDKQNAKQSMPNRLRKGAGLDGVKAALLRELAPNALKGTAQMQAQAIKALPLPVVRTRPIAEAISVAGGVKWDALDSGFMLKNLPGVFVAGEMIDWEAPTGGYLLSACLATGLASAQGVLNWLAQHPASTR